MLQPTKSGDAKPYQLQQLIPDLSGCSASGTTPEEAVREVQVALELWLEVASEKGQPIPPPRYRPASYA